MTDTLMSFLLFNLLLEDADIVALSNLDVDTFVASSVKERQLTERSWVGSTVCISCRGLKDGSKRTL